MKTTKKNILLNALLVLFLLLNACVAEEGPFITELDEPLEISFSTDIQSVFNNNCIQCHNQNHPTGLNLTEGNSYNLLVNVNSTNYAPNLRIEPFSLENSVLWHKISRDGVFGGGMPPTQPLSNFDIEKIEAWINGGALNN